MARLLQIKKFFFLLLLVTVNSKAFQLDLEGSLKHNHKVTFDKASMGIKKVFSDEKGDRLQLFLKLEAEDNFQDKNVDQFYVKYKGPMGRWNIAFGRSLVPFGLLTEYDSEMLILETQDEKTIGYKNDDGIKVSGFWNLIDYEILVSPGNKDKLVSVKTSFKGLDHEDPKFGLSFLSGKFEGMQKDLIGIDIIKYHGLLVSRNEVVFGKYGKDDIKSIFLGVDYSLLPSVDLNVAYSDFKSDYEESSAFLGLTYNSPFYGLVIRAGNKHNFENEKGNNKNEIFIQVYKSYSSYF